MSESTREFVQEAIELEEQGKRQEAIDVYHEAINAYPTWSVPHYNLGLLYKYQGNWQLSYEHNQRAVKLSPETEAAWWNLGIAATVLKDWHKAREAWSKFGLDLELTNEEPRLNLSNAPIRLNPNENAEVVWCKRIDPARALVLNVPLASSGHRFGDLVLNDGAPVGYRISQGVEYPVFNELQLLEKSAYKTYSVTTYVVTLPKFGLVFYRLIDSKI